MILYGVKSFSVDKILTYLKLDPTSGSEITVRAA